MSRSRPARSSTAPPRIRSGLERNRKRYRGSCQAEEGERVKKRKRGKRALEALALGCGFKLDPTGQKGWIGLDSRPQHIKEVAEENIGAAEIELTSEDLREIDVAASTIAAQGARYPENLEQMTGR